MENNLEGREVFRVFVLIFIQVRCILILIRHFKEYTYFNVNTGLPSAHDVPRSGSFLCACTVGPVKQGCDEEACSHF